MPSNCAGEPKKQKVVDIVSKEVRDIKALTSVLQEYLEKNSVEADSSIHHETSVLDHHDNIILREDTMSKFMNWGSAIFKFLYPRTIISCPCSSSPSVVEWRREHNINLLNFDDYDCTNWFYHEGTNFPHQWHGEARNSLLAHVHGTEYIELVGESGGFVYLAHLCLKIVAFCQFKQDIDVDLSEFFKIHVVLTI